MATTVNPPTFDSNLDALKRNIREIHGASSLTEKTYERFLKGHRNNLENAKKAMVTYIEWRKQYNIDNVNKDNLSDTLMSRQMIVNFGKSKLGDGVNYVFARKHQGNGFTLPEMHRFVAYYMEDGIKRSPLDEKMTICFDLGGFTLANMDFVSARVFIDILQHHYPEVLRFNFILNAPWIFSACWAVISPWLDPVTRNKFKFVNSEQLLEYIEYDQIYPDCAPRSKPSAAAQREVS